MRLRTVAATILAATLALVGASCGGDDYDSCAWCTKQGGICEQVAGHPEKTKCIFNLPKLSERAPTVQPSWWSACASCSSSGGQCALPAEPGTVQCSFPTDLVHG